MTQHSELKGFTQYTHSLLTEQNKLNTFILKTWDTVGLVAP